VQWEARFEGRVVYVPGVVPLIGWKNGGGGFSLTAISGAEMAYWAP